MKIAVTGASGKTGYRIVEEAIKNGIEVTLITRKNSVIPENLKNNKIIKLSLDNNEALDQSLKDMDALIIATGARATIDLTGPARVDALGVFRQLQSCKRVGIKRVILVSSLCTGKLLHPLNLFGLILLWKKLGENLLKSKQFDWTIIRPGGLKEDESLENENIYYSKIDTQVKGSIPRRLVAKCCINAIKDINSINKTIEITSSKENEKITFKKAMQLI
tara:strand:- start:2813 stop:3472 length:660 start_codon:yes stop_codon:yes gene_type:complete